MRSVVDASSARALRGRSRFVLATDRTARSPLVLAGRSARSAPGDRRPATRVLRAARLTPLDFAYFNVAEVSAWIDPDREQVNTAASAFGARRAEREQARQRIARTRPDPLLESELMRGY